MTSTSLSRRANAHIAYRQLGITGLTCAGEAAGLEHQLRQRPGILKATVNPVTECAYITYDPTRIDPRTLVAAVNAAGYGTS